jgi:polyphosphate kinase
MTLIVRREGDELRRFAHIGTGNYHAATARLYEDLGIFTADEEITADVADLFNYITGFGRPQKFRKLLVAPFTLRSGLVDEIRRVAAAASDGKHARIRLKLNHLVDPKIVADLYAASQAGARIDVVARSTCALRPGVEGLSENIHVRSIVGRFLEHSRIYSFEADERVATYIGSPDLMQRNLDHRIEVLMPVENARVRQEIHAILDSALEDDTNSWALGPNGEWSRIVPAKAAKPYSHHETLMRRSLKRARRGARDRRAG